MSAGWPAPPAAGARVDNMQHIGGAPLRER